MRQLLDWDEEYPVYFLGAPDQRWSGLIVDIPEELVNRYRAARAEWDEVQELLAAVAARHRR